MFALKIPGAEKFAEAFELAIFTIAQFMYIALVVSVGKEWCYVLPLRLYHVQAKRARCAAGAFAGI
jgi:hypothetical protein